MTWPPDAQTVAIILAMWPMITAVLSLFYNRLDKIPRVHAVLAILVKLGIDLPAMLDALKRLISGQSVQGQRADIVDNDNLKAAAARQSQNTPVSPGKMFPPS